MDAILKYFWAIFFAAMVVNVLIWRARLRPLVTQGMVSDDEVDSFTRGSIAALGMMCAALLAIQLSAGWTSPVCFYLLPAGEMPVLLSYVVGFAAYASLLLWVWRGHGADMLSRMSPALGIGYLGRHPSARQVRVGATVIAVAALLGGTVAAGSLRAGEEDLQSGCVAESPPSR